MLTLGGYLKKKESISARLGDVLSSMYLASMVLKHHEDQGSPAADLPIVEWSCRELLYQAQEQLHGVLRNFPVRPMAWLMRLLHFSARADLLCARRPARPARSPAGAGLRRIARPARRRHVSRAVRRQPARRAAAGARAGAGRRADREETARRRRASTGRISALDLPGQVDARPGAGHHSPPTRRPRSDDYDELVMDIINVDEFAPELGAVAPPRPSAAAGRPMYLAFFGLAEKPFAITPDPRYLYLGRAPCRCARAPGVRHQRRRRLHPAHRRSRHRQDHDDPLAAGARAEERRHRVDHQSAALAAGVPADDLRGTGRRACQTLRSATPRMLVDLLNRYLLRAHADGRRVVLIVDEAQNLTPRCSSRCGCSPTSRPSRRSSCRSS